MMNKQAATVSDDDWLTYQEAAAICGCSRDTIKRRREDGTFPRARQQGEHRSAPWLVPIGDLVEAGFIDASQIQSASAASVLLRTQAEMLDLRVENAGLKADVAALLLRLEDKDGEIAHLRKLSLPRRA